MSSSLEDKGNELKGMLGGLRQQTKEVEQRKEVKKNIKSSMELNENDKDTNSEKIDIESIFLPNTKEKIVNKGFTIREDQAKKIERYSRKAKKKESEFLRDVLDYVFSMIESEG